ncbi:MAG: ABC transporter substrate-binding protein [Anaerolineaceae bacterium]|nr:ABC transporter substrate-binding protein [Anaerolineaceae bacterium]
MKKQVWRTLFSVTLILSMGLSGCNLFSKDEDSENTNGFMSVEAPDCNYGGEIKSVQAVDAYTVKFTLCAPDVSFPAKLTSPVLAVQDRDYLNETNGDSAKLSATVNGTGAFRVKDQGEDQPLQLRVSNTYWGTPPKVTDILVDWYDSTNGPLTSYETTVVDVANSLNNIAEDVILKNDRFSAINHDPANVVFLGFNNKYKPFDNQVVREAIAVLLDTKTLVQDNFPAGSEVATQVIPANITPGHSKRLDWYEVRPKDAIDALGDINFDYSQKITLAYERGPKEGLTSYQSLASQIQQTLISYGFNVQLKPLYSGDYTKAMAEGTEMMFIGMLQPQYLDGAAFYELAFEREAQMFGNTYPEIVSLLQQTQAESSDRLRQDAFDKLNQKFKDQVPFVPIGHFSESSYVRSGNANALANAYYENYEDISNLAHTIQILDMDRPLSLWPADETDWNTFRVTRLLYDNLVETSFGSNEIKPALADSWSSNSNATEWTFMLRYNIQFSNGAALDSNDVVASFVALWDASSPNHTGRTGEFKFFRQLFGGFINEK